MVYVSMTILLLFWYNFIVILFPHLLFFCSSLAQLEQPDADCIVNSFGTLDSEMSSYIK